METKRTLADDFFALNADQRRAVHFALCEHALKIWHDYANARDRIVYKETVAGSLQEVDKQLPSDALAAARQARCSDEIAYRYREPIVAWQDEDLVFPENISFAYFAIYNLFNKYAQQQVIDDWLIVNQALSSEDESDAWDALLKSAIQAVRIMVR